MTFVTETMLARKRLQLLLLLLGGSPPPGFSLPKPPVAGEAGRQCVIGAIAILR